MPKMLNPDDLLRLAQLLKLQSETMRLFSHTDMGGNGEISRITALAIRVATISDEIAQLAVELGATEAPDAE